MARYVKGQGDAIYKEFKNGNREFISYSRWVRLGRPGYETDWTVDLQGSDRDAAAALTGLFEQYGLGSLAPNIVNYIKQGYAADTVTTLLQNTDAYKKRFSANDARRKAGLRVLSPAEYLSVEDSYRAIMSAAGLPKGFYDSTEDFSKWIAADVSPTEVQGRVDAASELVNNVDPDTKKAFSQYYTKGDLIAYALDRKRSTTVLNRQVRAAEVGGAADAAGVTASRSLAERIADEGVDGSQARQGFSAVAQNRQQANLLSRTYGIRLTEQDLIDETFFADADATERRTRLASRERAAFSGSGGQSATSLSRSNAGQL